MSFGMKQWTGLVLAGLAFVALYLLPPAAMVKPRQALPTAAVARASALTRDVQRTHELLKRLRWTDSLPAHLAATAVDGVGVGGPPELGVDEERLNAYRGLLVEERRRLGSDDPEMLFGFYLQMADQGAEPGVTVAPLIENQGDAEEMMAGEVDGRPYCILVRVVAFDRAWPSEYTAEWRSYWQREYPTEYTTNSTPQNLGGCRLFVRYGRPGSQVFAWMKSGGIDLVGMRWYQRSAVAREPTLLIPQRGRYNQGSWGSRISLNRCLAGIPADCLAAATTHDLGDYDGSSLGPFVVQNSSFFTVANFSPTPYAFSRFPRRSVLLADLEMDFGTDAFRSFWTSDKEVPEAFHDAFGVAMGDWLLDWVRTNVGTEELVGPRLPRTATFGGILVLALCMTIAGAWERKRSVT